MESFVTKLKIKRPSLIYTHEADLDGFMSGLILNMVSKVLFKKGSSIRYINYDTMDKIEFRPNDAIWISDLNFPVLNLKPQKNRIFIIDHHKWEQDPTDEQVTYLHNTTKSATLQCFEVLEYVVNELENSTEKRKYKNIVESIRELVRLTNIGDVFIQSNKEDLLKARSYSRFFIENIKPNLETPHLVLGCKPKEVLYSIYNNSAYLNYNKTFRKNLEQDLSLYREQLKDKSNEIKPGIFNVIYEKGDYSLIFNILLEENPNIKAILTAIKNPNTGKWSLSVRSRDGKSAYYIANKYFGGGGHPNAAGAGFPDKFVNENIVSQDLWYYINDQLKDYEDPR